MFWQPIRRAAALLLVGALAVGCGGDDSWVEPAPADGFAAQYADAANSGFAAVSDGRALSLQWNRSVKGSLYAAPAISSTGFVALNGQTAGGCSLMVWENANSGRQRWCTRLVLGGGFASPLFDGFDNLYIGQPGAMVSFPTTQWTRWRTPVIGMPQTPRFVGDGRLLVTTHLGQVLILNAHRGSVEGSPIDLVAGVDPRDPERGLTDCRSAGPQCPVAAAPAFSAASGIAVVTVWQPGAPAAVLTGLRYSPDDRQLLTRAWTSDAVGAGVLGSPVMSHDGETVYVNGRDGRLWALAAADGAARWSIPLGYDAQFPPSVSPSGEIIAGGAARDSRLVALRDEGDRAEVSWRRDDVAPLTAVSQAGSGAAFTVVGDGDGDDGLALLVIDPADGGSLDRHRLPRAAGWPVGVSIGADGRVVTATSEGTVYSFAP